MPQTSASQTEMLVDFMERNGDLSKPSGGPRGRLRNLTLWQNVTSLLNGDGTGEARTTVRWRKVWSDLKNNTKRKHARIEAAARGTGGGPASRSHLTDLEQRVLAIMGPEAATGNPVVPEIGLEEDIQEEDDQSQTSYVLWEQAGPSTSSTQASTFVNVSPPSPPPPPPPEDVVASGAAAPSPPPSASMTPRHSPRRRPRRRPAPRQEDTSPTMRRARRTTQSEAARQAFLNSDREWRAFLIERERERSRIREMELQQQARWQDLAAQFLTILNRGLEIFRNN